PRHMEFRRDAAHPAETREPRHFVHRTANQRDDAGAILSGGGAAAGGSWRKLPARVLLPQARGVTRPNRNSILLPLVDAADHSAARRKPDEQPMGFRLAHDRALRSGRHFGARHRARRLRFMAPLADGALHEPAYHAAQQFRAWAA